MGIYRKRCAGCCSDGKRVFKISRNVTFIGFRAFATVNIHGDIGDIGKNISYDANASIEIAQDRR
jgi:hypothetical protein